MNGSTGMPIITEDSRFKEWYKAKPPDYSSAAIDLNFPYSEYPLEFDIKDIGKVEFNSVSLPQHNEQILDFWGEGRINVDGMITGFKQAYNVNHQFQLVSNGTHKDQKIPNRIPTRDYDDVSVAKYVPSSSFDTVTLMGSPLFKQTAAEIARIVTSKHESIVVIYGFDKGNKKEAEQIRTLMQALDVKKLVILPNCHLHSPLNEITMPIPIAFRTIDVVKSEAKKFFYKNEMSSCVAILVSLQENLEYQPSGGMALRSFFSDKGISNSYWIFSLGYELNNCGSVGQDIMNSYMNNNIVKIVRSDYKCVQFKSSYGESSYLCPKNEVSSYDWAIFAASTYLGLTSNFSLTKLCIVKSTDISFEIRSLNDDSVLCTENVSSDGNESAFFAKGSSIPHGGQVFRLIPQNGGNSFAVESQHGATSYLYVDGEVASGGYKYAYFGTQRLNSSNKYFELYFE